MNGSTGRRKYRKMEGRKEGWLDGWMDGQVERQMETWAGRQTQELEPRVPAQLTALPWGLRTPQPQPPSGSPSHRLRPPGPDPFRK